MNTVTNWTDLALSSLSAMGQTLMSVIPKVLGAIFLLGLGWIIAKAISKLVARILRGAKIDRWTKKLNGSETMREHGIVINTSKVVSTFIYWLVMLAFFITASDTLGWQAVSQEVAELMRYLPKLLSAVVIFVIGMYIANFIKQAVLATFISLGLSGAKMISSMAFYVIIVVLTITALNQAGIRTEIMTQNITLILGSVLLSFALAFGLGSRELLQNILSGFYSRRSFHIGERVRIDGVEGVISAMDSVNVSLKTPDGKVVIPASTFLASKVEVIASMEK